MNNDSRNILNSLTILLGNKDDQISVLKDNTDAEGDAALISSLRLEIQSKTDCMDMWKREAMDLNDRKNGLNEVLEDMHDQIDNLNTKVADLAEDNVTLRLTLSSKDRLIADLEAQIDDLFKASAEARNQASTEAIAKAIPTAKAVIAAIEDVTGSAEGYKIKCIKAVKTSLNIGLREAKGACDAVWAMKDGVI